MTRLKRAGNTLALILGIAATTLVMLIWPANLYRLTQCDFEENYKCEVLHSLGVIIPPTAIITVWFGDDS